MNKTSSCGVRTPLSPLAQATIDKHLPNLSLKRGLQSIHQSQNLGTKTDASCLTDICNGDNLPEIEICSLLEEKIPKYRIRLDVLTNFTGYSNHDWFVPVPALHIPDGGLGLTKNQTRETLNYFLLCGNRVSQMTRAYDDIEAVTRLLEEKEKDLELTIQIGKELLAQNVALESRIADLEINIKTLNEDRAQLLHEMQKKAQLISILTNDIDDNSENDTPTFSKSVTLDLLQKKISSLQDENKSLKIEASQIVHQTDEVEEQERKLMEDITMQLNVTNSQFDYLNLELERQKEENRVQHEQIVNLTSQYTETQMRLNNLIQENEEQSTLLNITKENQNALALELVEFKTRYEEVLSLLQEAQEQLRKQRKKAQPQIRSSFISSLGILPSESLHSELMESSLYSENSIDSGFSGDRIYERIGGISSNNFEFGPHKKTFEMLRYTTLNKNCNNHLASVISSCNYSGPRISAMQYTNNSRLDKIIVENVNSDVQTQREVLASNSDDIYPSQPSGIPGTPGAKDLEAALRRLTTGEVLARRAMLSYAPLGTYTYEDNSAILPIGSRTPDSMISTESSGVVEPSNIQSHNYWRFPEKLQIVKPIEGSQTLHHWSKLATPTLSGLLEDRPGVTIRGGRGLNELGMQVYSLSDVEEDIDSLPGKQFEAAGCIYTFTTSTVLHPDDGISSDLSFLSKSQMSSRLASVSTSRQPSCPQTPNTGLSRRNSCSTFSIYMGLASVLNERGIKAVTPSALSTPTGQNYSPTSTPCNSPESSPPRTPPPDSLFSFLSLGAEKIRKKISCEEIKRVQSKQQKIILSRLEKRSLRSLKLVEKVERIGLENIIATKTNAVFHLGNGIASRSASPTIYLPNSKDNESSNVTDGSIQFNRDQIKCVLSKGLASTQTLQDKNDPEKNTNFSLTMHEPQPESCLRKEKNSLQTTSRSKQIQRQKTRRTVKNGIAVQRQDLGTIDVRVRPDLGSVISAGRDIPTTLTGSNEVDLNIEKKAYVKQSVVGSISSLLFGRKGGWL